MASGRQPYTIERMHKMGWYWCTSMLQHQRSGIPGGPLQQLAILLQIVLLAPNNTFKWMQSLIIKTRTEAKGVKPSKGDWQTSSVTHTKRTDECHLITIGLNLCLLQTISPLISGGFDVTYTTLSALSIFLPPSTQSGKLQSLLHCGH